MSQVPPTSPYPQPGEVIDGKYKVERVLGQGGMGAVVKAVHLVLRAPVALKFMNPQYVEVQGAVDRFLNEGVASKRIASDHVLHVDDVGKLPSGAPYLVMDCLDGRDLAQVLEAEGKPGLPAMRAVGFVLQILRALQAAHATSIIHRDMKPSNCFVIHKDGDDDFVKILDFGISKIQDPGSQSLTQTHSALGTPLYMSAEQARSPKEVDARSDLYSVAVILYELLSGRTPFRAESGQLTELLFKLFTADPDPLDELVPDLPPGLWDVVRKGLAREPIDRYASALLFAEALEPFTDDKGRALIARMQRFVAPEDAGRASRAIPPSAVAFSELGKGASLGGTPLAGGVSQAQAEAAVRTLGMAGTEVDRRSSVPPPAAGAPPHGPAGTVAMPDRPSAIGGIAAPRAPRENDVTYPRPDGGNLGSSAPALSATQPTRDTQAGSQRMLITGAGIALAAVVVAIGIAKLTAAPVPANVNGEPKPTAFPSVAAPPTVAEKPSAAPSTSAAPSAAPSASAHAAQPKPSVAPAKPQPTHVLQTGIQN